MLPSTLQTAMKIPLNMVFLLLLVVLSSAASVPAQNRETSLHKRYTPTLAAR
jgi:hypothetical protein